MKKISILLIGLVALAACTFQKTELDQQLLELINIETVEKTYEEKEDTLFEHVIKINDDGVYYSQWLDESRVVNKGIKRVKDDVEKVIVDLTQSDQGVENFIEFDGKLYYSSYTPKTASESDDVGGMTYDVHVYDEKDNPSVLSISKGEEVVNIPQLFTLNNKLFATLQVSTDGEENIRAYIYNITDQKEEFSIKRSELSINSDFILGNMTTGLEDDSLTFAITRQKGDNIISSIYTFDGTDLKENVYNDIYIYDLIVVSGQAMFSYNKNVDDTRYIGYLNKDEDLVQTEIVGSTLTKLLDINEGTIVYGRVGKEGSEMYHFVEINGMDIAFESVSIFDNSMIKERTDNGFYTINNDKDTKTIISRYTLK